MTYEKAEIQANLQSALGHLVKNGNRHCHHDLGILCDVSIFFLFTLCAETLFPPYISSQA